MTLIINRKLQTQLEMLQASQSPIIPGGHRHPTRKNKYFRALAEAFEAGCLKAVHPIKEGQSLE